MRKASQKAGLMVCFHCCFCIVVIFNANATGNNPLNSGSSQTYSETLNNIPVQVNTIKTNIMSLDLKSVNVHLRSANRIQLNMESNADTRNFQVVADLTNCHWDFGSAFDSSGTKFSCYS